MACPWWDSDELRSKNKEEPKVEDKAEAEAEEHHKEEMEDQNEEQQEEGFELGYEKGYEEGYDKGVEGGYDEGYQDCLQESCGIDRGNIEYAISAYHGSDHGHDCSNDSVYGCDDVGTEYDFESDHGGWSDYD